MRCVDSVAGSLCNVKCVAGLTLGFEENISFRLKFVSVQNYMHVFVILFVKFENFSIKIKT